MTHIAFHHSPYLDRPLRFVEEACRTTGRDDCGQACLAFSLNVICFGQGRHGQNSPQNGPSIRKIGLPRRGGSRRKVTAHRIF